MLTVICGEDVVASRQYFLNQKVQYQKNNFAVHEFAASDIDDLKKWLFASQSLFFQRNIFFTEHLVTALRRKKNLKFINEIESMREIEIIDWENISLWEMKGVNVGKIKEFKPEGNIFKLLDACYPTNKINFMQLLHTVLKTTKEEFIFIMLARHIRNLILVKNETSSSKIPYWQLKKLQSQAKYWPAEEIVSFYASLFRIDKKIKTSVNPFTLKGSLELLTCYYL